MPISRSFSGVMRPFEASESAWPFRRFLFGRRIFEGGADMAKAGNRVKITLRCSECKQRNYNTTKNKRNTTERLELNKYCPFCRKHTVHNETK